MKDHFQNFQSNRPYTSETTELKTRHTLEISPWCADGHHHCIEEACECPCHIPSLTIIKIILSLGDVL